MKEKIKTLPRPFHLQTAAAIKKQTGFGHSRGLYLGGFITASVAAYMTVFILALGRNENGIQNMLRLQNMLAMSFILLFVILNVVWATENKAIAGLFLEELKCRHAGQNRTI